MPASGRFLLDTNIVIALLAGEEAVLSNLERAREVFISAIVVGELFFGAAKSGRSLENIAKVERFAADRSILLCDLPVAREYGRLRQHLRAKGRPLKTLVQRCKNEDEGHFSYGGSRLGSQPPMWD